MNNRTPDTEPVNNSRNRDPQAKHLDDQQTTTQAPKLHWNPRLVFVDPDSFFCDLLMEQEEQ